MDNALLERPQQPHLKSTPTPIIVVMGVSGCGKTTVGQLLAQELGLPFLEGDALHPERNVRLMSSGQALSDADRQGWLEALATEIARARSEGAGLVLSCSALKRSYRDVLRSGCRDVAFVHLQGSQELLSQRVKQRTHHYMPASLLASQYAILEVPQSDETALSFDVQLPVAEIVRQTALQLQSAKLRG